MKGGGRRGIKDYMKKLKEEEEEERGGVGGAARNIYMKSV